jgi:hypothetical protein
MPKDHPILVSYNEYIKKNGLENRKFGNFIILPYVF